LSDLYEQDELDDRHDDKEEEKASHATRPFQTSPIHLGMRAAPSSWPSRS
jgi:hypothetical protein